MNDRKMGEYIVIQYKLLLIPIISALIGWFTNFLAVRMIFRPYMPVNLFVIRIQGLIPKRKDEIATRIGHTISRHLITHKDILDAIKNNVDQDSLRAMLDEKLDEFINGETSVFNQFVLSLITKDRKTKIKNIICNELVELLPNIGEKFASTMEKNLDIKGMITKRVNSFDLRELEKMILEISSRELKAIELYGGVLGFMIGIVQVMIILL
ncbi:MAG: DUF445 domain-containing protein [bacterium]